MELKDIFKKIKKENFIDCEEAYTVYTDLCQATIGIDKNELVMSHIYSNESGGGSDMLNKLEEYSKAIKKDFVVSNIINPKLEAMVIKRGYVKKEVPFAPEHGIMDLVEIYIKQLVM